MRFRIITRELNVGDESFKDKNTVFKEGRYNKTGRPIIGK